MTFWHRPCCREEWTFHVSNVVNLPDNQFLYVIGEFNYSLWNIAMNEPAFGSTGRWAVTLSSGYLLTSRSSPHLFYLFLF
jgi:hypothetical protein